MAKQPNSRGDFDEIDPFNGNRVRGHLIRTKRRRGDLVITHVNGEPCEQTIWGAPRIPHFEPGSPQPRCDRIKAFEKIDGTNVLLFHYRDANGRRFTSYKTRLSPFLRLQAYGDFIALWKEILARYCGPLERLAESRNSVAFELFGSRLPVLTQYEVPLDARLLYALDPGSGMLFDPEAFPTEGFPVATKLAEFPADTSPGEIERQLLERHLATATSPVEGAVLYYVTPKCSQVAKCKPEEVKVRQARYRELYGVSKAAARATRGSTRISQVLEQVTSHVAVHWPEQDRATYREIVDIVCAHVTQELAFEAIERGNADERELEGESKDAAMRGADAVLFSSLWGSHLWGMETPTSDRDRCVVYQLDERTVLLAAFEPKLLEQHRTGWRRRTRLGDEQWYEIGRVVQLLLQGSLTMLYCVMSPLVDAAIPSAHAELRALLVEKPSRACFRALMRDVRDSEKRMAVAEDRHYFEKHLRIACRNLAFGITLFTEGRYEFRPSAVTDPTELRVLERQVHDAYQSSHLPEQHDPAPFYDYLVRQRRARNGNQAS